MDEFTKDIPTEIGEYEIKCAETDYFPERVSVVYLNDFIHELYVNDPNLGRYPLDLYHHNLINLSWRKLEGDEISGCADDQKFGFCQ